MEAYYLPGEVILSVSVLRINIVRAYTPLEGEGDRQVHFLFKHLVTGGPKFFLLFLFSLSPLSASSIENISTANG
jgi:hypothetical protein